MMWTWSDVVVATYSVLVVSVIQCMLSEAGKLCIVISVKRHMDGQLTIECFLLCGQEQRRHLI